MEKISKIFLYFEHEKQARRRSMSEAGRGATESERPRDEGKGQLRSLELSASWGMAKFHNAVFKNNKMNWKSLSRTDERAILPPRVVHPST